MAEAAPALAGMDSPGVGADTTIITPPPPALPTGADTGSMLDWRGGFEPELRNDPVLQQYKTMQDAARGLVHAQRMIGRSIQLPQGDNPPEGEWQRVWEKLGWPKAPGDYQLTEPDLGEDPATHEARTLAPEFKTQLLETAHAVGLNSKQTQAFLDMAGRLIVQSDKLQQGQAAMREAEGKRSLAQAFGASAPRMMEQARLAFEQLPTGRFGGEYGQRAYEKLKASELFHDPDIVATFSNIWEQLSEGQFLEGTFPGLGVSRDTIQAQINELMAKDFDGKTTLAEKDKLRQLYQQRTQIDETQNRQRAVVYNGR